MNEALDAVLIAKISLSSLGAVVEDSLRSGYCDPSLLSALLAGEAMSRALKDLAIEAGDAESIMDIDAMIVAFQVTVMEAGEVMNELIDLNNLPVKKNTFEDDPTHPNYRGEA